MNDMYAEIISGLNEGDMVVVGMTRTPEDETYPGGGGSIRPIKVY